jgi:hypothetical protein
VVTQATGKERVRHKQTAHRDLYWFVPQCDIAIAYFVKVVFTFGVVDETVQASQMGKQAWIVFPSDYSPFLELRITPNRIFRQPEELFHFVENEFMPEWISKWQKQNGRDKMDS